MGDCVWSKIMVIGAHAGDAELMAGGIACKVIENGGEAIFIHMSLGEKGIQSLIQKNMGCRRKWRLKRLQKKSVQKHFS